MSLPNPLCDLVSELVVVGDGSDEGTTGGVAGQFPEEGAAQALCALVAHLAGNRARRVVAPPLRCAEGVGCAGYRAIRAAASSDDLVVLDACFIRARCCTAGGTTRCALAHACPAASIEADTNQQLAGGYTLALELLDGRISVEAGYRNARV